MKASAFNHSAIQPSGTLSVRNLRKNYGALEALRDISFSAQPSEIFGLLGPNGAGKTSTLECILGLRRADAGEIFLGELDLLKNPAAAKSLIGAQLQSAQLQDKITPREALRLFGDFYPRRRATEEMLAEYQLSDKAGAPFATLSGGQKQRLFLALAFVHEPQLVILDEPTAGLDPTARRELHHAIVRARARGCTIVLSTHDLAEAEQLCDRVAIIDRGCIVASDTIQTLVAASRAHPRLRLRTSRPMPVARWANLASALDVFSEGDEIVIATKDVNDSIAAVVERIRQENLELLDLRVQRPSLEDIFFERTGRSYPKNGDTGSAAGTTKAA